MKQLLKYAFLFMIGGGLYFCIEIVYRGFSHWTMCILGGVCFILIGLLNEIYTWATALISQMVVSSIVVTVLELVSGIAFNIWLGWGIWDYSQMPYNLMGQICLLYTNLWFLLSLPAILIDDCIRYFVMGEERPKYKIF